MSVVEEIKKNGVKWIFLQFTDILGKMRQITVSSKLISEETFKKGVGKLDGSSIEGFKGIEESDLVLVPVPETFAVIPWMESYGRMLCKIYDTYGETRLAKDPRSVAEKAEEYLEEKGFKSSWGPEVEFFIFDKVEVDISNSHSGQGYKIYSMESPWSGKTPSIDFKKGYYPTPPVDQVSDIRCEIAEMLETYFGFTIEAHHHEVATAGQSEINFTFGGLTDVADRIVTMKYVVKNVAANHGMTATFMPKPLYGDNASGMHVHQALWRKGENLFYDPDDEYANLSQIGRYYIGGLLKHARAISAIVSPTVNSYKRLVPGFEAPVYLVWSRGNRSAAVRVPIYHKLDIMKRIEYRPPDPSANPYLAIPAMLAAGLDGINRKIDPGDPIDEDIYLMSSEKRRSLGIKELPRDLWEALDDLESDMDFLKIFFPMELLETYIEMKRSEFKELSMYPTPIEIYKYLDL